MDRIHPSWRTPQPLKQVCTGDIAPLCGPIPRVAGATCRRTAMMEEDLIERPLTSDNRVQWYAEWWRAGAALQIPSESRLWMALSQLARLLRRYVTTHADICNQHCLISKAARCWFLAKPWRASARLDGWNYMNDYSLARASRMPQYWQMMRSVVFSWTRRRGQSGWNSLRCRPPRASYAAIASRCGWHHLSGIPPQNHRERQIVHSLK